jgi:hypothetical protein
MIRRRDYESSDGQRSAMILRVSSTEFVVMTYGLGEMPEGHKVASLAAAQSRARRWISREI